MVNFIVVEKTFGGSLKKSHALNVFNVHNDEVRSSAPPEQLLVYDASEGWEPLCAFLDVEVPATPYPRANTRQEFRSRFPVKR
jgi:Sulfotransferase domain